MKRGVVVAYVNDNHLNRLYQEVQTAGGTIGAIWIYCEAPDYRLVGDEDEGFTCVDDVARALVFYCRQYASKPTPVLADRIKKLAAFLLYMRAENGFFYNFLLPDGQINTTHQNSKAIASWWTWRAFWALSELNLLEAPELADTKNAIQPILANLASKTGELCRDTSAVSSFAGVEVPTCIAELGADQASVIVMALVNYYATSPSKDLRNQLLALGHLLLKTQYGGKDAVPYGAFLSWQNYWHAWGNAQAYALLKAGSILKHQPFIEAGLAEVRQFYPYLLSQGLLHEFQLVRENGQCAITGARAFPQIAYDLCPMVLASLEAYKLTGNKTYAQLAGRLAAWFLGDNPVGIPVYDSATGRGFDGIGSATDVNKNSGAESTIEALLGLQALETSPQAQIALKKHLKKVIF